MLNAKHLILKTVCFDNVYSNLSTDYQHLTMQLITSENLSEPFLVIIIALLCRGHGLWQLVGIYGRQDFVCIGVGFVWQTAVLPV